MYQIKIVFNQYNLIILLLILGDIPYIPKFQFLYIELLQKIILL